jgi:predicted ATPase
LHDDAFLMTTFGADPDAGAPRQDARLWELCAATSCARFRRGQGGFSEAREILGPIYRWFTEGFGTSDLKAAKKLLAASNWRRDAAYSPPSLAGAP